MTVPDLEPAALELRQDDDGRISLSIAISLKRIADALEPEIVIELPEPIAASVPLAWPIELTPEEAVVAARRRASDIPNIVRGVCTTCANTDTGCDCVPF